MNDKAFQGVLHRLGTLLVEEFSEVKLVRELYRMVKFDFVQGLKVEDKSLEMDKEERWERVKTMIFLNSFYLGVTGFTEIIADDFCFSIFVDALLQTF